MSVGQSGQFRMVLHPESAGVRDIAFVQWQEAFDKQLDTQSETALF